MQAALELQHQCSTDADIVLKWLQGHASQWKTVVSNRVAEIQTLLPEHTWRHVRSESNPADILSRGASVDTLINTPEGWSRPVWLNLPPSEWPETIINVSPTTDLEGKPRNYTTHLITPILDRILELFERSSKWTKIIRVIATVRRFIFCVLAKARGEPMSPEVKAEDISFAESYVIRYLQQLFFSQELRAIKENEPVCPNSKLASLDPYLEDGIIRVGGRLVHSELSLGQKHPIVLARHRVTKLLIEYIHDRCEHGGLKLTLNTLRQTFWVLNPRPQVKSVIFNCLTCAKVRAKLSTQIMANLPPRRVLRPPRVFTDCGVDYAGPLRLRLASARGHKSHAGYIVIYVCFAIKAVHLEIATDYTSEAFIASFQRFVSRRGYPSRMYSDCGTNFKGADRELHEAFEKACNGSEFQSLLANNKVAWHFNATLAPHFGGLWEAGVRSVKGHLKKILKDKTPTYEELSTLLCQIEAALNSRPLGPLHNNIEDFATLTPGHFLAGGSLVAIPQPSLIELNVNRLSRWQMIQQCYELFWRRWSEDYLQSLQQRSKWPFEQENIKVGQMVLLSQPNLPPTKWPVGRIREVLPNKTDNKVRVVRVTTAASSFLRPIAQVALLPIDLEREVTLKPNLNISK